jgi:hypothetical protein
MAGKEGETFEPVTLGHIRSHGCRDLLVYCGSINCNHSTTMNADHMPDDTPIRALGSRMVCTKCGHVGADVRPDWSRHVNKRHVWFLEDYLTQMSIIDNAVITVALVAIALLPIWLASKVIALVYGQIAKRKLRAGEAILSPQPEHFTVASMRLTRTGE